MTSSILAIDGYLMGKTSGSWCQPKHIFSIRRNHDENILRKNKELKPPDLYDLNKVYGHRNYSFAVVVNTPKASIYVQKLIYQTRAPIGNKSHAAAVDQTYLEG